MKNIEFNRNFMKANYDSWKNPSSSDQMIGKPAPPLQKAPKQNADLISLPMPSDLEIPHVDLYKALVERRSVRQYSGKTMTLGELSYLLDSTCRIQKVLGDNIASFRPAPSGGARHPFETYLIVNNIEGLENGHYHYLPLTHQLEVLSKKSDETALVESVNGQKFTAGANVVFYLSAIPYRAEWRYGLKSHKVMLIDLGHLGQNLYLAAEGIHAGACAIASYDQEKSDALFELDGVDEFIVYIVPVGKK
jgi:SagB-type dehydrogenase family enzyme